MNRFSITTPIYYVNDKPRIGHTYSTIAAEALSHSLHHDDEVQGEIVIVIGPH